MCVRFYLDGFTVLFVAIYGSDADASSMRTYDLLYRPWFIFVFGKPPKIVRNQMSGQVLATVSHLHSSNVPVLAARTLHEHYTICKGMLAEFMG